MNIKDKIEEIRLKACDDFDKRTKFSKNFCIEDYRRSEDYKYWKRRVGSTMHLSRAEECIEHMKTIATHDFDFNTNCLIVKLFEAGLIKDESLDSKKRFEDMSMQELMDMPDSPEELEGVSKDESLHFKKSPQFMAMLNLVGKLYPAELKEDKKESSSPANTDKFQEFFEHKLSDLQANVTDYLNDPYDQSYFVREFWEFRDSIRDYLKRESEGKND